MLKSKISNILKVNNIEIKSFHIFYDKIENKDRFIIKITKGQKTEYFDFYMGVRCRKRHSSLDYNLQCKIDKKIYAFNLAVELGLLRVNKPNINDILSCLCIDYDSGSNSIDEFCSEFGYDVSKRETLDIYLKCQENRAKIKKLFSEDLIRLIQQEL